MCFSCLFEQQVCFGLLQCKSLVTSICPVLHSGTVTDIHIFPFASEKHADCTELIDQIYFLSFIDGHERTKRTENQRDTDIVGKGVMLNKSILNWLKVSSVC